MRKIFVAATLTVFLAASANAADVRQKERGGRDRDNPIVRMLRNIVRTLTPGTNTTPTIPIPERNE